ncbi:MAG TPA: inorganic phosphate transporter [Candidatus Acidoferrales bacterium]|nr:inorganic phosphate transporter [Candidatus Acidoferrales bacterium]
MLLQALLIIATFVAVALVSGNNLSACVGSAIGSKTLSQRTGILLGAAGFLLGLLIQGSSMITSVHMLLPNLTAQLQLEVLLAAILVFVVADIIRAPISFSMSLVGLLAGLSFARKTLIAGPFVAEVVILWFVAPLVAIALSFHLIRAINKRPAHDVWSRVQIYKFVLIVLTFSTSYVLGANTIGMIVATGGFNLFTILTAVAAILVGSFYLSRGEIKRVSQELFLMRYPNATVALFSSTFLVEMATIFKIPLPTTQTMSAALFGTAISYRTKFISLKPFAIIVAGWIIAPLLSFAVGLII